MTDPTGATPPQYGAAPPQYGQYGAPQDVYGAPVPAGSAFASWGRRVGGYVIDFLIVVVPSAIIGGIVGSASVDRVLSLIGWLILSFLVGSTGRTPGMAAVGIKLVRDRDGRPLGGGMGIVRWICHIIDTIAILIGWFWPLWDAKRQTFADKIVSTVVLRA